jgi:serine phosphatase RsbU (regulator of sigma subunit)
VQERRGLNPQALIDVCVQDLGAYRGARRQDDDVTIMAIRRVTD